MKNQNNPDNLTTVEISNSRKKEFLIVSLIYFIMVNSIVLLFFLVDAFFAMMLIFGFIFGYILFICVTINMTPHKNKISINNRKILVFIKDNLFLEIEWNKIEEIIIFEEIRDLPPMRYRMKASSKEYSLEFKGKDLHKTLRLWCLAFRHYHQKKVLKTIRNFGKTMEIQVNVDQSFRPSISYPERTCEEYTKFYNTYT